MSHYGIIVALDKDTEDIPEAVDSVLTEYNENLEVPIYVLQTVDEIKAGRQKTLDGWKDNLRILTEKTFDSPDDVAKNEQKIIHCREVIDKYSAMTDEEYYRREIDGEMLDEEGSILSTRNPHSRWDWYVIGGRWEGALSLKDGTQASEARVKDIRFKPTKEEIKATKKRYKEYQDRANGKNSSKPDFDYIFSGFNPEQSEEDYIKEQTAFSLYSFIDKNGEWHERAECGWFGTELNETESSHEWRINFKKRFIDNLNPDDILVVVDCHT